MSSWCFAAMSLPVEERFVVGQGVDSTARVVSTSVQSTSIKVYSLKSNPWPGTVSPVRFLSKVIEL